MNVKNDQSRITIDIPKTDHKKLKAMAAIMGKSMRAIIVELIEEHLSCNKSHIPNKKTLEAINSVENGKNLVTSESLDTFFEKLGR